MKQVTKLIVNGTPCIATKLTIAIGARSSMRNVKSNASETAALLGGLHEGTEVDVKIFGLGNMCYSTSVEQIEAGAQRARDTWHKCDTGPYFEKQVEKLKVRFGDGTLSMDLSLHDVQESFDEIKELVSNHLS